MIPKPAATPERVGDDTMTPREGWVRGTAYPRPSKPEPKWKLRRRQKKQKWIMRRYNEQVDK